MRCLALPRKTIEEADDWSIEGDQVNRVQIEREPITEQPESRRLQEVIPSFHVSCITYCMVGQQRRIRQRNTDSIAPNMKSLQLRMVACCVVQDW